MKKINEPNISGKVRCSKIPSEPGVYMVTDGKGCVLYIGYSNCLRRRIAYLQSGSTYLHTAAGLLKDFQDRKPMADVYDVYYILDEQYKKLEKQLINKYSPPWNNKLKKRHKG